MERCEEPPDETESARFVLEIDPQNFHAWSYFGWFAGRFAGWKWLFELAAWFINRDPLNNSAWAARYRAVRLGGMDVEKEIEFALQLLRDVPRGEAIANYVRGLLEIEPTPERMERVIVETGRVRVKTRTVFQLAAHVAKMRGNREEYEQLVDQIVVLDPRRAQFWAKMKEEPSGFE
jgi:protein farnesyltransferase/geranylgeranyltransferase type-1 subunit alpha